MKRYFLGYYGGKVYLAHRLLPLIHEGHHTYVEVFGGGAALLLAKPASRVEVYNDIDENVVALFRCLTDKEKLARLVRALILTPYSRRETIEQQKALLQNKTSRDDVERALRFFVGVYQGFSYSPLGWSRSVGTGRSSTALATSRYRGKILALRAIHHRVKDVIVECMDFEEVIRKYDNTDTLFYCDPPYVASSRVSPIKYLCEMSDEEHLRFLQCALRIQGKMIISNYHNPLYEEYLASWQVYSFKATAFAGNARIWNKSERTEVVWLNYQKQMRLEL